jgi:hypothetical protein
MTKLLIALCLFASLAACSGGADDSRSRAVPVQTAVTAEGIYSGTSVANESITGVVLDNGAYYVFFGPPNGASGVAGVVFGTGTSSNGDFSSTDGRDLDILNHNVTNASVAATYVAKQSLDGTISVGGHSPSFTSTYDSLYDQAASLSSVVGSYSGQAASSAAVESATFTVSASGTIGGTSSLGCSFTGTLAPHGNHGGVYDITLSFGMSPCAFANTSLTGVAVFNPNSMTIVSGLPNASRTDGVVFSGQMQRSVPAATTGGWNGLRG